MTCADCMKHFLSLALGIVSIAGVGLFFVKSFLFVFKNELFPLNLVIMVSILVTGILIVMYLATLIIASCSASPCVHVTESVLSLLLGSISIVAIVFFMGVRDPIVNGYKHAFTKNQTGNAQKIEKAFDCCGWSDNQPAMFLGTCNSTTTHKRCYDAINSKIFKTENSIICITALCFAIICFILVAWIEISLTRCERADYDRLELRPIQNF